jgi:hypothetical protein
MTEHLTFIIDKNYSSDINDKYICKNNYPKSEIRISID